MTFKIQECTIDNVRDKFESTIFLSGNTNPLNFTTEVICSQRTYDILIMALKRDNLYSDKMGNKYPFSNCIITVK